MHGGQRVVPQQGVHRHHNAGRAEPALAPVAVGQPLLMNIFFRLLRIFQRCFRGLELI